MKIPKKICVIKTDGIGDAVLASPFFYELRRIFKNSEITGVLSPAGKEALDGLGIFDNIITADPVWVKYSKKNLFQRLHSAYKTVRAVNRENADILIGMRYQDRMSSLMVSAAKAEKKYGYDVKGAGFGIDVKMKPPEKSTHVIFKNLSVLNYLKKNYRPGKIKTGFSISKKSENEVKNLLKKHRLKKFIIIHPESGYPAKDWPVERYAGLMKKLSRQYKLVVPGGAADKTARKLRGKNIYNFTGKVPVKELGSLIKRAKMVIGNDSAAVHIASVFNVKSLTVFSGTERYSAWMARGKNSYIITKHTECTPCHLTDCRYPGHDCMDIDVSFIEEKVKNILAGRQKQKIIKYPG